MTIACQLRHAWSEYNEKLDHYKHGFVRVSDIEVIYKYVYQKGYSSIDTDGEQSLMYQLCLCIANGADPCGMRILFDMGASVSQIKLPYYLETSSLRAACENLCIARVVEPILSEYSLRIIHSNDAVLFDIMCALYDITL